MGKIKVLYVSHFPHLKLGGQRSMTHLIENLDRSRFEPYALTTEPGELSEKLESMGCKCFFVPLYSLKPKYLSKIAKTPWLIRKILKNNSIDIVHPDFTADTFLCGIAKKGLKTKMVWHVRWNESFKKDQIHARMADGIIGVSDAAGKRFADIPGIEKKYKTIYNGVDCDKFAPADKFALRKELDIPSGRLILVFVGALKDGKGILDIANALSALKSKLSNEQMPYMYFIGSKQKEETYNNLIEIIETGNLREDVEILSQKKNIEKWMQAADVLLIPSHEGNEGMPRVMYEAMACATAVIGSDTSGINEGLSSETGFLVPEKSPDMIADALMKFIENSSLASNFGYNGRKRAIELFDIKKHALAVETFYLRLLDSN